MTRSAGQRSFVDAPHSSPRDLPDGRASNFDVRKWLAGLVNCPANEIRFVSETERRGRRTVTYVCNGQTAKVRMASVAAAAAWELVAETSGTTDRVVLPAGTHFVWRPRGAQP
jgi:hypothetical protein